MSPEFLATALLIVVTPGIGVVYTINAGLERGRLAGAVAAIGCTLGILPHLAASFLGLSALLATSAELFTVVKLAGVAFMLHLAWTTWRDRSDLTITTHPSVPARRIIASAVLVNLLNPKLTAFFFVFLPQFVPTGSSHATAALVMLSGTFVGLTLIVFLGYGVFAGATRQAVLARPWLVQRIRRVFAGAYLVLAGRLAFAQRS